MENSEVKVQLEFLDAVRVSHMVDGYSFFKRQVMEECKRENKVDIVKEFEEELEKLKLLKTRLEKAIEQYYKDKYF